MALQSSTKYLYANSTGALVTGLRKITMIAWVSDQAAGKDIATDDDFLLSDINGKRIIGKRAKFAGDDLGIAIPGNPLPVNGIEVTTMDGGVVYVWIE